MFIMWRFYKTFTFTSTPLHQDILLPNWHIFLFGSRRDPTSYLVLQSYHMFTGSSAFHNLPHHLRASIFITTIINGSMTSGRVQTTFEGEGVIRILRKPAPDISNYRPISVLSFPLNTLSALFTKSVPHRATSKIPSLASKWYFPQRLPFWLNFTILWSPWTFWSHHWSLHATLR